MTYFSLLILFANGAKFPIIEFRRFSQRANLYVFLLAGLAIPEPVISQIQTNQAAFFCIYKSDKTKTIVFSDIIMFTRSFHAGWEAGGKPKDDRPYSTYRPEFTTYMATKRAGDTDGWVGCDDYDSAADAGRKRDGERAGWSAPHHGYTTSIATGWRPASLEPPVTAVRNPGNAAALGKRDSLIVRKPDDAPKTPVATPTPKPATKAKPAATPVPKKPLTQCGGKGQRRCQVKPM